MTDHDKDGDEHPLEADYAAATPKTPAPVTGDEAARRAGSANDDVTDTETDD